MTEEKEDDLIWRLRHPLWQHYADDPPQLEKDATQSDLLQAANEIERLRRRVAALELVIAEEMHPSHCHDDANRMLVEGIYNRQSQQLGEKNG